MAGGGKALNIAVVIHSDGKFIQITLTCENQILLFFLKQQNKEKVMCKQKVNMKFGEEPIEFSLHRPRI